MDYHHWIKITKKFQVRIVGKTLAKFRCDEGTVSWSQREQQSDEMYRISRKYWGSIASPDFYKMALSYFKHFRWNPFKERVVNSARYRLPWLFKTS